MRNLITDTIELLGYKVHVIFNYRDYPVLLKDVDVSPILGYHAPDGVATYCYRHNNDLILFLDNSKYNYTTPKVIYHLIKNTQKGRKPLLSADQFWTWYTHDIAHLYYEDTNGNLINHIKNVHTINMWNKPKSKKVTRHSNQKASKRIKNLIKQSHHNAQVMDKQAQVIKHLQKSISDYHNQINNITINSYADKVFNLIRTKPNTAFRYSLFKFTELLRNLGLVTCTVHSIKEWLIDNNYLIKVGWNDYVPAHRYNNLFFITKGLLGNHITLSQQGFVYFTNTIYNLAK